MGRTGIAAQRQRRTTPAPTMCWTVVLPSLYPPHLRAPTTPVCTQHTCVHMARPKKAATTMGRPAG